MGGVPLCMLQQRASSRAERGKQSSSGVCTAMPQLTRQSVSTPRTFSARAQGHQDRQAGAGAAALVLQQALRPTPAWHATSPHRK
jgi:hypothetical protein